jgi:assimilatory nitrate reductase catalytic subunit
LAQGVRRGQIFAPIHWTEQVASDARIGKVVNPVWMQFQVNLN